MKRETIKVINSGTGKGAIKRTLVLDKWRKDNDVVFIMPDDVASLRNISSNGYHYASTITATAEISIADFIKNATIVTADNDFDEE